PPEHRLTCVGVWYRDCETDERSGRASCPERALNRLSGADAPERRVFDLSDPGRVARGHHTTAAVEHEKVHAGRAAALHGGEKRGDPFVEVSDANLAHYVLRGERLETFPLRAKGRRETVGTVAGLLNELSPDDPRKRRTATRECD